MWTSFSASLRWSANPKRHPMASPKQVGALTMASTMVFAVAQPFEHALIQRPKKKLAPKIGQLMILMIFPNEMMIFWWYLVIQPFTKPQYRQVAPASPGYPGIPCDELVVALRRYSAPRQTAYAMEELEHPGTGTYERQQESWGFHSHGSPTARC